MNFVHHSLFVAIRQTRNLLRIMRCKDRSSSHNSSDDRKSQSTRLCQNRSHDLTGEYKNDNRNQNLNVHVNMAKLKWPFEASYSTSDNPSRETKGIKHKNKAHGARAIRHLDLIVILHLAKRPSRDTVVARTLTSMRCDCSLTTNEQLESRR